MVRPPTILAELVPLWPTIVLLDCAGSAGCHLRSSAQRLTHPLRCPPAARHMRAHQATLFSSEDERAAKAAMARQRQLEQRRALGEWRAVALFVCVSCVRTHVPVPGMRTRGSVCVLSRCMAVTCAVAVLDSRIHCSLGCAGAIAVCHRRRRGLCRLTRHRGANQAQARTCGSGEEACARPGGQGACQACARRC